MKKQYSFLVTGLAIGGIMAGCSSNEVSTDDFTNVEETGIEYFASLPSGTIETPEELETINNRTQENLIDENLLYSENRLSLKDMLFMSLTEMEDVPEEDRILNSSRRNQLPYENENMRMVEEPVINEYENLDVSTFTAEFTDGEETQELTFVKTAEDGHIEVFDGSGIQTQVDLDGMEEEMHYEDSGAEEYPTQLKEEYDIQ